MDGQPDPLTYGYWPARELGGSNPPAIQRPEQYDGSSVLCLACTQTSLGSAQQKKLVAQWCEVLPTLKLKALLFRSKVNQPLFEAAVRINGLEALFIKWSSIGDLGPIAACNSLASLYVGSSPSLYGLQSLSALRGLRHLFIQEVRDVRDLSFVSALGNLDEFGLSGGRGPKLPVDSLRPLSDLRSLKMLWLVNIRILNDGLAPLHELQQLASLRTSMRIDSPDIVALCKAVPSLNRFKPVWV